MSAQTSEKPANTGTGFETLIHLVALCPDCWHNYNRPTALCGWRCKQGSDEIEGDCVVCLDLHHPGETTPCGNCGRVVTL